MCGRLTACFDVCLIIATCLSLCGMLAQLHGGMMANLRSLMMAWLQRWIMAQLQALRWRNCRLCNDTAAAVRWHGCSGAGGECLYSARQGENGLQVAAGRVDTSIKCSWPVRTLDCHGKLLRLCSLRSAGRQRGCLHWCSSAEPDVYQA